MSHKLSLEHQHCVGVCLQTPWLDGRHVVFGKILEGEDFVKKVEGVGSNSGTPSATVTIVDSGEL